MGSMVCNEGLTVTPLLVSEISYLGLLIGAGLRDVGRVVYIGLTFGGLVGDRRLGLLLKERLERSLGWQAPPLEAPRQGPKGPYTQSQIHQRYAL